MRQAQQAPVPAWSPSAGMRVRRARRGDVRARQNDQAAEQSSRSGRGAHQARRLQTTRELSRTDCCCTPRASRAKPSSGGFQVKTNAGLYDSGGACAAGGQTQALRLNGQLGGRVGAGWMAQPGPVHWATVGGLGKKGFVLALSVCVSVSSSVEWRRGGRAGGCCGGFQINYLSLSLSLFSDRLTRASFGRTPTAEQATTV